MDRLLILSCSQRKTRSRGRVPAIERYDGPAFRVLRKYLRDLHKSADSPGRAPTVLILSAKYGLIDAGRKIPWYDRRISKESAAALRPGVLRVARRVLRSRRWRAVGLCAGREYQSALQGVAALAPAGVPLEELGGGLGKRLTALRNWLRR